MAGKKVGSILVDLDARTAKFRDKFQAAKRQSRSFQRDMDRLVYRSRIASTAVVLAFSAMAAKSLKMAIDVHESENLFSVSMGKMADAARSWSKDLSKSLGLNQYELRRQIGVVNNMLTAMGMTEKGAFSMSKQFVELAQDMASFFDLPMEEAFQKLQSGISGEIEPLRRLGIMVDQNTVKQIALRKGLIEQGQELTQLQKTQLRWVAILDQTQKAQGDLARTMDSPANKLRRLRARFAEISTTIGVKFIGAFSNALDSIDDLLPKIENLAELLAPKLATAATTAFEGLDKMVRTFTSLPKPIQDTAFAIGAVTTAVWLLTPAVKALATAAAFLAANPIGAAIAGGIAVVGLGAYALGTQWEEMKKKMEASPRPFFLDREKQTRMEQARAKLEALKDATTDLSNVAFVWKKQADGSRQLVEVLKEANEEVDALKTKLPDISGGRLSSLFEVPKVTRGDLMRSPLFIPPDIGGSALDQLQFGNLPKKLLPDLPKARREFSWFTEQIRGEGLPVLGALKEQTQSFGDLWQSQMSTIRTDFGNAMADLVLNFQSATDTMLGLLRQFARVGIRILAEQFFNKIGGLMSGAGGGGGGGILGWLGKAVGVGLSFIPGVGPALGSAFGALTSAFSGAGKTYSLQTGGVINEPAFGITQSGQTFTMAEAGPEAITPLGGRDDTMLALIQELRRIRAIPAGQFVRAGIEEEGVGGIFRGEARSDFRRLAHSEF